MFTQIVPACAAVLQSHPFDPNPTLESLLALDTWARKEVASYVAAASSRRVPVANVVGG
jgi:hypothetical protein